MQTRQFFKNEDADERFKDSSNLPSVNLQENLFQTIHTWIFSMATITSNDTHEIHSTEDPLQGTCTTLDVKFLTGLNIWFLRFFFCRPFNISFNYYINFIYIAAIFYKWEVWLIHMSRNGYVTGSKGERQWLLRHVKIACGQSYS